MHVRATFAGCCGALAVVATAVAAKPAPPSLSIGSKPNPVVFGSPVTLTGRLTGSGAGGHSLTLQEDPYPYGDGFADASTAKTNKNGRYSFIPRPQRNTRYRVVASGSPAVMSGEHLVSVRRRVGLRVSDTTPRRGRRIRFSGTVLPASAGKSLAIQRRTTAGRWTTVARTVARDAGADLSTYSVRVRIRSSGVYRVKVLGDLVYVNGISRTVTVTVS